MINLQFLSLNIEGFQSIGTAGLDFNNLGTCFIKGVNKYDTKTKSNGSGKSSLLSSICWCLFGKTPAGIGNDVVNKFSNTGCNVELSIKVDGVVYDIRRSQNHHKYKTNLTILKDSEDISGRNKSDSDKVIKEIIKSDEEIFSQMIFLSQGFANRFAVYTPKARKDLLESLYNIDEKLENFVNDLKIKESVVKQELDSNSKSVLELTTKNGMLESTIVANNSNISQTNTYILGLQNSKSNITKDDIDALQSKYDELVSQVEKINEKYMTQYNKASEINRSINDLRAQKTKCEQEIQSFSNNKVCPTCGTVLENYDANEHIQKHIAELKETITAIDANIEALTVDYNSANDICLKMSSKLTSVKSNRDAVKSELATKSNEYQQELQKDTQIKAYQDKIIEYTTNIESAQNEINNNNETLHDLNSKSETKNKELEIVQHSIRLANNQFKSYLLENIISMLNNKLKELSVSLFENEIIRISGDAKLDITLGEKTYEQLSGGEQRKVDVAIIIAQRFLAQQMNSISSNILILDEIFDGLDDVSFSIVLDLLSDEMQDVESTFIISHRDIKEIPFDKVITVTKNQNQVSEVELS